MLDEVLTNVISYAYGDDGEHEVLVRVILNVDCVTAEFDGRAFNPLDLVRRTFRPDSTGRLWADSVSISSGRSWTR
jgi:anti-sigma regulatory factor (Ser/Thr protein kinase)